MKPDAATVLIVDDQPLNIDLLEQELEAAGYRTVAASNGEQALACAAEHVPELILLDVMMPGLDGYETCRRLKASEATRSIPVIFLTALKETFEKVRAFELGAVDYVTKPFESEELLARVGTHVALRREIEAHRRSKATIRALVEQAHGDDGAMVGASAALVRVREQIAQVAPTDSTVLIPGETGTGKELVARAIHEQQRAARAPAGAASTAPRCRASWSRASCSATRRAPSPAPSQQRRGRFELADGGTLLLDEVGELPPEAQAKLLRVLQEREFERVGGTRSLRVDVRVIAATNRDLARRGRSGTFPRRPLLPPERVPDRAAAAARAARRHPAAASNILGALCRAAARPATSTASRRRSSRARRAYDWPGNVRELENVVERALIMAPRGAAVLDASNALPVPARPEPAAADSLVEVERAHVRSVLEACDWVIEGDAGAARALGLHASTLRARMRKLGLRKPARR